MRRACGKLPGTPGLPTGLCFYLRTFIIGNAPQDGKRNLWELLANGGGNFRLRHMRVRLSCRILLGNHLLRRPFERRASDFRWIFLKRHGMMMP